MSLNQIKPVIEELNGKRCVIVEKQLSESRLAFLSKLLIHNKYQIKTTVQADGLSTLGVTDLLFNPVLDVYKRRLLSITNHKVTPNYWLQINENETMENVTYWKQND